MRLGIVLCKWPKSRPPGNINLGKRQMVKNVMPWHKEQMQADIDREKKNIFLCMHPAASVEQERALYKEIDQEEDELKFKLNKAWMESVVCAPKPLKAHYKPLAKTGTWQKF